MIVRSLLGPAFLAPALLVLTVARVAAADGFVIESRGANLAVGAPVGDGTALTIDPGGHVVVLTEAGRMLRRNGPFSGSAGEALGAAPGPAGGALRTSAVEALIDLARDRGTAQNRAFATRGSPARGGAAEPFGIGVDTRRYCHRADVTPAFTLANPPAQDVALTLDRLSPPAASHSAYWPAGQPRLPWPADWPAPRAGDYIWSAGYAQGEFRVEVHPGRADPGDLPRVAAELKAQGCDDQARAALRRAVREARVVE